MCLKSIIRYLEKLEEDNRYFQKRINAKKINGCVRMLKILLENKTFSKIFTLRECEL